MLGIWLGVMALALALALATWIVLVMRAGRGGHQRVQENFPHRELIGGTFVARQGGRQVMPDPQTPAPGQDEDQPETSPSRHPADPA